VFDVSRISTCNFQSSLFYILSVSIQMFLDRSQTKVKKAKVWVIVIALLTRLEQQRFTISEQLVGMS